MNRKLLILVFVLTVTVSLVTTAAADSPKTFPDLISIPDGFQPEGIAIGRGSSFFVGSIPTGAIYKGDLRTGDGELLVQPSGTNAVGLAHDDRSNNLFVADGFGGGGVVYDADSGHMKGQYSFGGILTNDVIVTRSAAYFTDSFLPFLYRIPLGPAGQVPTSNSFQALELTGDWDQVPGQINANGIEATADGRWLIVVNLFKGLLYRVDPFSGYAQLIELSGGSLIPGVADGLVLQGNTLYVVENFNNNIVVISLGDDYLSGKILANIGDSDFQIPTTAALFGNHLYAVNARFDVAPPDGPPVPDLPFHVVAVDRVPLD